MQCAITSWVVRTHAAKESGWETKQKDYEFMLAREADEWELAIRAQKAVASRLMEQLGKRVGGDRMGHLVFTWRCNVLIENARSRLDLESEIVKLKHEVSVLTTTNQQETEARESAEEEVTKSRHELSANKVQLEQNAVEISTLESQLVQAKALLRAMEQKRTSDSQNQKDLDILRDQLKALQAQIEQMSQEHLSLELTLRKRLNTVEAQRKKLKDEADRMQIHTRRVMQSVLRARLKERSIRALRLDIQAPLNNWKNNCRFAFDKRGLLYQVNMLLRSHGFEAASNSNADSVFALLDSFFSLLENRVANVSRERDAAMTKLRQYETQAHELADKINQAYYRRAMGVDIKDNVDWELQESLMQRDAWVDSCAPLSVPSNAFSKLDRSLSHQMSTGSTFNKESNSYKAPPLRDLQAELVERIHQMSTSRSHTTSGHDLQDELVQKISHMCDSL